jgi:hypothetical protein
MTATKEKNEKLATKRPIAMPTDRLTLNIRGWTKKLRGIDANKARNIPIK